MSDNHSFTRNIVPEQQTASPQHHEKPLRIAVLVSGSGSNLQALIDAIEAGQLSNTEIALVVSNKANAQGLQRALRHNLPALHLPWRERVEAEAKLTAILQLFAVDLIILAGWMRIFSTQFIAQFSRRIINLHPALLPDAGTGNVYLTSDSTSIPVFRGLHAVKQALDADVKLTGSTVHYVTAEVDAGPAICRAEVRVEEGDTEETLHERIKQVEHWLIVEAVRKIQHE
ncbi:MAG: phosphoribosylglycinamide formyltransferase [Ktedonobacteraceae bacterium]|nr:phosphoribosylglycinamide formyltransferase [Ktedonobacteraceae bacterium]